MDNRIGIPYDQMLCVDAALPNATTAKISTNVCTLDSKKAGNIWVRIFSSNSVTTELAAGATLAFTPYVGLTADACTTVLPATFMKEAVTSDTSWASGELICEFVIPKSLIGNNKFIELYATTSANESADYVEAYLFVE